MVRSLFAAACVLAFAAPSLAQDCQTGQCSRYQRAAVVSSAAFGVPTAPVRVSAAPQCSTCQPERKGLLQRIAENRQARQEARAARR